MIVSALVALTYGLVRLFIRRLKSPLSTNVTASAVQGES
jgi:hypothetical protein